MTREYWQARKHLVDAFCDGKTIQQCLSGHGWQTTDMLPNDFYPAFYRVKPEPKLRPWTVGEFPLGALWRMGVGSAVYTPDFVSNMGVNIAGVTHGPNSLYTQWQHSLDNGRTWLPCGVMEDGE